MSIALKNAGSEIPAAEKATMVLSKAVPRFTAASTPSGIPASSAINKAAKASISVPVNASEIMPFTGFLL